MAFKKVSAQKKYVKYAECSEGDTLVSDGEYLGSEEGKYGIQHNFKQKDGTIVVLNKSGHLDWLLDNYVSPGQRVNISYGGKSTLTKGDFKGKEAHTFELEIDDESPSPSKKSPSSADVPDDDITL